ncbi:short chain dehydrogenase [compost metagenome]
MFTAQIRRELAPADILVHAVHPGWIKTDMGGDNAPGDADHSAAGILDLAERTTKAPEHAFFVDHSGKAMPL